MSEDERKRHGIYDNIVGELQRNLRLLFPGLVPTRLDTSTYEKFETDMWMLPQSDDITRVYVKIKDLNHRLASVRRDHFKESDLWMELRNEVPALQSLLINGRRAASSSTDALLSKDDKFMRIAIEEARLSRPEDARVHPRVGVVVVKDGATVKQAHRGELALGDHAEYTALERKLGDKDLTGVTIVTTLEPCTKRGHERTPCAERIILRRVARVVIGMLDPNPSMQGKGVYMLKKAGIQVAFCSKPLEDEIKQLNKEFIEDQLSRIETIQPARFDEQFRHVYAVLFSHGGMPLPNYRRIINRKTKQGFLIGEYANRLLESGKIEVITETWTGERAFEEWFGKNGITPIDTEAKRTDLVASKLIGFHITSTTDWFEIGIRNGRLLEPVKQEINKGTIKFIGYDQPDRFHVNQGDSRLLTITIEANFELGSRTLFMRKGDYGYVEFSLYQNEEYDSENEAYRLPVETKQYLHYRSLAEKNEKEYPIPEEIL